MDGEQLSTPFSDLGVSPTMGAQLMETLDLTSNDLGNHKTFNKLKDVFSYLGHFGEGDVATLVRKITAGKPGIDKLDFLFEYVSARQALEAEQQGFNELEQQFNTKKQNIIQLTDTLKRLER